MNHFAKWHFGWMSTKCSLHQNVENMTIDMITFVVLKDIYDYHDYSAYIIVAKAINRMFGHSCK
jgi:hypothetical protein